MFQHCCLETPYEELYGDDMDDNAIAEMSEDVEYTTSVISDESIFT